MTFLRLMALSAALHGYVAWRLLPALGPWPSWSGAGLLLLVSALAIPLGLMARRVARPPLADGLTWVGMTLMGAFSSLWVLTLLRDVLWGTWWLLSASGLALPPANQWVQRSGQAVLLAALAMTLWGFVNARRTPPVRRVQVPVVGLPPALHGFTVVQITDLHVGPTIQRRYVQRLVRRVNALGPTWWPSRVTWWTAAWPSWQCMWRRWRSCSRAMALFL